MHRVGFSITRELEEGAHHIRYELADYIPVEFDITVVAGEDRTYHRTLTPFSYDMKIDLSNTTLLDSHDVLSGETANIKFYIRNNGNVDSKAFYKWYLDGTLVEENETDVIPVGSRTNLFTIPIATGGLSAGDHEVKLEVGPSGRSVTDTKTDTLHVIMPEPVFKIVSMSVSPDNPRRGQDTVTVSLRIKNEGTGAGKCDVRGILDGTGLPPAQTDTINVGATIDFDYQFLVRADTSPGDKELKIDIGRINIAVHDSRTTTITVRLGTALITFASTPEGASVYVDGVFIGTT